MAFLSDIPRFGFGTAFKIQNGTEGEISEQGFKDLLQEAIELGCRHIDCAPLYGTQALVGQVLENSLQVLPRSELFITSKLPVNMMRLDFIEKSLKQTLKELKLAHLDLFLIHGPFSTEHVNDNDIYPLDDAKNLMIDDQEGLLESCWTKLVELKQRGYCRFVGLSNINPEQLNRVNKIHQVDVVQNEYHLYNQDRGLFERCKELGVHFEAFAAFGCPPKSRRENKSTFLDDPAVRQVAIENNLSEAQVVLQWLNQKPLSYVIRSDNPTQLAENLKAIRGKLSLSEGDINKLNSLNRDARLYFYDNHNGITRHREYPFKKRQEGELFSFSVGAESSRQAA